MARTRSDTLAVSRRGLVKTLAAAAASAAAPAQARATPGARFTHGVASGDPTADSLVIWTRALPLEGDGPVEVAYEVSDDPGFGRIVQAGTFTTHAERDHTVKVDVRGLRPGFLWRYRFRAGEAVSPVGQGRTLPAAGHTDQARLAVVSCSNYPFGYFNAYRAICGMNDLDAVVHLGDYIYEYGPDGYGGETGRRLGRVHEPAHEIVTLDDYRRRFAQYRSDPDLQAVHAHAAFITLWDDHETANNSWSGGAQNHDEATEGRWEDRRDAALQAYFEWLPMRDPAPGAAAQVLNRVYDFGDVATVIAIETRLTGRSRQLSATRDMVHHEDGSPDLERFQSEKLADPSRSLMGPVQEAWLDAALKASTARGAAWRILANQVVVARMRGPDFFRHMPEDMVEALPDAGRRWLETARWGLPINLDSWDGYWAARLRLYDSIRDCGGRTAILSGDTHMFWGNHLHDPRDERPVAVEFGVAGVTSPGGYDGLTDDPRIFDVAPRALVAHNPDVRFANVRDQGFLVVTARKDAIACDYYRTPTVLAPDARAERFARLESPGPERLSIVE